MRLTRLPPPLGAAIVVALLASFASARSWPTPSTSGSDIPTVRADDPHEEMRKLFEQVELRLRQIDRLLGDAAAGGERSATEASASSVRSLLNSSRENAEQTVKDIDRILELADHPHPPGGT